MILKSLSLFAILLLFFVPVQTSTLFWGELADFLHFILFFIISVMSFGWFYGGGQGRSVAQSMALTLLIALSMGALVELLQQLVGREASLQDLINDAYGIVSGLLFVLMARGSKVGVMGAGRVLVSLGSALFLFVALVPLVMVIDAYYEKAKQFPVITDLSARWTQKFAGLNNVEVRPQTVTSEEVSVMTKLLFKPSRFPGVEVRELYKDWRGKDALVFTVKSDEVDKFKMHIRLHDARHSGDYLDRYNKVLTIKPGINEFRLPLSEVVNAPKGRLFELSQVEGLIIYMSDLKIEHVIWISKLRLI